MGSTKLSRRRLLTTAGVAVGSLAAFGGYRTASADSRLPTAVDFVAYVTKLYRLAQDYGGDRAPDELVTEFLRHKDYNDWQWDTLVGAVDERFTRQVCNSGLTVMDYFVDPFYGIPVKISHFGASCNGVLVKGKPTGASTNGGDVAGWGGDLITFFAEWQRDKAKQPSGYDYCLERLARKDVQSTFMLDDLIEDADAFNVAMMVRSGSTVSGAVKSLFLGVNPGYRRRFEDFRRQRFGAEAHIKDVTKNMLLPSSDEVITLGRNYLIRSIGGNSAVLPEDLKDGCLDGFCQGFAHVLNRITDA
jgi:hypothetical protein